MKKKHLYRSRENRIFAGVAAGMAEYFEVDPIIIRILFVLFTLCGGVGIIIYLASLFIVPQQPLGEADEEGNNSGIQKSINFRKIVGYVLVIVGVIILLINLNIFSFFHFWHISWGYILPILLILFGMAIIYYKQSETISEEEKGLYNFSNIKSQKIFRRSSIDKKLFGVCGGLAQYFDLDSSIVRILYIILCLASFGIAIVLYITLVLLVPTDKVLQTHS